MNRRTACWIAPNATLTCFDTTLHADPLACLMPSRRLHLFTYHVSRFTFHVSLCFVTARVGPA
jgi:hypothetical protein